MQVCSGVSAESWSAAGRATFLTGFEGNILLTSTGRTSAMKPPQEPAKATAYASSSGKDVARAPSRLVTPASSRYSAW